MIKKYVSKFTIDILPSIIATIVGAYIVTHYINPKPDGGKPAAAMASAPDAGIDSRAAVASPAEKSSDLADAPAVAGPRAKVEKAGIDKSEKPDAAGASEPRRHQPARDKAAAKAPPAAVTAAPPMANVSPAAETAAPVADERRDANDLARAAIERLRGANEAQPRPQEAARTPEPARAPEPPRVAASPVQPLPPAIMVSAPPADAGNPGQSVGSSGPSSAPSQSFMDPRRPRPPGDIPQALPLDIQADATGSTRGDRPSVAEDVLTAAKSVFHSVLPRPF